MLDARFLAWLVPMPCLSPCGCYTPCGPVRTANRGPSWRSNLRRKWMPDEDSNLD